MNIIIKDITKNITEYRNVDYYSMKKDRVYIYYDKDNKRHTIIIPLSSILSMDVI